MRSGRNGPTTTGCWRCPLSHPSPSPPLTAVLRDPGRVAGFGGSIWDRAVAAKADILQPRDRAERCPAEPGGHPHQRRQRERRRAGPLSHATDRNSGRGSYVPPAPSAAPSAGDDAAGTGVEGMEQILKRETHSSRAVGLDHRRRARHCAVRLRPPGNRGPGRRPAALARGSADRGGAGRGAPGRGPAAPARRHWRGAGDGRAVLLPERRAARTPGPPRSAGPPRRRRGGRRSDRLRPGAPGAAGRQRDPGTGDGDRVPAARSTSTSGPPPACR